jgi:hypothetical protein
MTVSSWCAERMEAGTSRIPDGVPAARARGARLSGSRRGSREGESPSLPAQINSQRLTGLRPDRGCPSRKLYLRVRMMQP